MFTNRIPEELYSASRIASPAGFLMIPMAAAPLQNQSPLQGIYQQLYEQAVTVAQVAQRPQMPDLFVVMN
jgi:hypothetical protein